VAGAKQAIFEADVVALVLDANEGPTDQDAAIGGEADRAGRGIVIVANKWDLVKSQDQEFVKKFDDEVRRRMKFLEYAPILHISALTGERAPKVLETIDKIAAARRQRIPTPALNRFLEAVTAANPPVVLTRTSDHMPRRLGRAAVVRVLHQRRDDLPFSMSGSLNQLREQFVRRLADSAACPARAKKSPKAAFT
jgi:small GTP-binding protein